ncbi:restriction endonuclease subunit S [Paenibacillus taichungensis]|uniref:restriction endonuclease subunit S n=1 Tax=Paenibacillus taichungensis TaxID=484184 RepID=UPI0039A4DBC4
MKSNYKRLGDYIHKVDNRNTDLKVTKLLGLSMTKEFRETTSNTVGTDMSIYKVMSKWQFACDFMSVIRVYKLPVVLKTDDEPNLVSPAYPVFEVNDTNELHPEYLMMWFRRTEFDRYAFFKCDSAIRGGFDWVELCNTTLPIPSINKQKEIVKEYNVLVNRINLNYRLIQKIEETAQVIYKHWFVDYEFPDENGKPYKSNGGEMEFNKVLNIEIPKGWEVERLGDLIDYKKGYAFQSNDYIEKGVPIVRVSDFKDKSIDITSCYYIAENQAQEYSQYKLKTNDIIISTVGSWPNNPLSIVGKVVIVPELANNSLLNQNAVRLRSKKTGNLFLYYRLIEKDFSDFVISGAQGSANQASVTLEHLFNFNITVPSSKVGSKLEFIFNILNENIMIKRKVNYFLESLKDILLSKLATLEDNL